MEARVLWLWTFYATLLCHVSHCVGSRIDLTATDAARYEHGKAKLIELRGHSRYGPCWAAAVKSLETGCRQLTEDVQHELALKFTECFLLKTGRSVEPYGDMDRTESTRRMSSEVFNAYTEFFTHTQNICFYLQASEWQLNTEQTIDRLTDSSENVVHRLETSENIQQELLSKQKDSMHMQEKLLEGGMDLRKTLEESKVDVQVMVREFENAMSEQNKLKNLVFEVFDRVQALQSVVMGEFTGFYSFIFYALAVVIAYFLTSTPRTSAARFWLFLILTLNVSAEWIIAKWYCGGDQLDPVTGHPVDENVIQFSYIYICAVY